MQLLLRSEGNPLSSQPQAYLALHMPPSWEVPPPQQQLQQPHQHKGYAQQSGKQKLPPRIFDPLPIPHIQLLQHLLKASLVERKSLNSLNGTLPPKYDANARCEYHANSLGHTLESYWNFRYKVQDLIDNKQLTFEERIPLVNGHPLL